MPPLIHAALCWIAGAFLGSVDATDGFNTVVLVGAAAGGGVLVAAAATWRDPRRGRVALSIGLATLSAAAAGHARASRTTAAACRIAVHQVLVDSGTAHVVFDDHLSTRGSSRGVMRGDDALSGCRVPIMARATAGSARAGQWVLFRGTSLSIDRGLRVSGTIEPPAVAERDWRRAVRARAGDVIDRDFGRNAPLVRALLIADQDGIDPRVRDVYADAGLVHMLSISGLHVAIIAGSLLTLASALRASPTLAFGSALVVIVLYVVSLGAPAPAVRSAVMLAVVGLSQRTQRPTHPWTALALGAVIPTFEPGVVLDLGWQLSVSGMAALVAARSMLRRVRLSDARSVRSRFRPALRWFQEVRGWQYTLVRELVTGVVATAVTAPIIAWYFGRISAVAPLSNIAAGPLVAFAQPALFLAILLSPWPSLSQLVASSTVPALAALDVVAEYAAAIPHASLRLAPTGLGAVCAALAAAACVRATASRRWIPAFTVACAALTLSVWAPVLTHGAGRLELHVLDVGQGDALAVRTPRGRWILVDAGRRWDGGDAGRRTVVPYVRRFGGSVAAFVLSHAHDDHVGGAASVIEALHPERWWEPAFVTTSTAYRGALASFRESGGRWHQVSPGDQWTLDGLDVQVLAPDSAWTAAQHDANETSVVLRVAYGSVAFLLTGDAEAQEEGWLLANTDPALLRADVLKLGHHGSRTSSTSAFVDAVSPRVGVVSVGAGNTYRHPSTETLETFTSRGIPVIRTDLEGTIVVSTDGKTIEILARGQRWVVAPP